ncbi:MAG: alpha/beta fold hydrolase [Elusimicrobia bacterium]|nr:alpha/beta fold hydrolase [Elusimicrobiota bacterium]
MLLGAALLLRVCGAVLGAGHPHALLAFTGRGLCLLAGWIAACILGAWCPLWVGIVVGLAGEIVGLGVNNRAYRYAVEGLVIAAAGLFSVPPLPVWRIALAVLFVLAAGILIDRWVARAPASARWGSLFFVLMAGGALIYIKREDLLQLADFLKNNPAKFWNVSVTRQFPERRIVLDTGAVAWIERPALKRTPYGALFFHGANPDGSHQSTAVVVKRALLNAGVAVLSVDHPGYGESPSPPLKMDLSAWDPLPTALSALEELRRQPGVEKIIVVGHSMGSDEALRLLSVHPAVHGVLLLGAALSESAENNDYWNRRFLKDRRIREPFPLDWVQKIQSEFYDTRRILEKLSPQHPPILFVRFGREHPNIAASRDVLLHALPGRKRVIDLPESTHYLNSGKFSSLILGEAALARHLSSEITENFGDFDSAAPLLAKETD